MVVLVVYIWDQVMFMMNQFCGVIDMLNYYKNQVGSFDGYLLKFQDVFYYCLFLCFNIGCMKVEFDVMKQVFNKLNLEVQKKVDDVLFKGLDKQQDVMEFDVC